MADVRLPNSLYRYADMPKAEILKTGVFIPGLTGRLDRKAGAQNNQLQDLTHNAIPLSRISKLIGPGERESSVYDKRVDGLLLLWKQFNAMLTRNTNLLENAALDILSQTYPYSYATHHRSGAPTNLIIKASGKTLTEVKLFFDDTVVFHLGKNDNCFLEASMVSDALARVFAYYAIRKHVAIKLDKPINFGEK